ncbi:MAG: hypothetical protein AAGJ79_01560 [Verrucomicrobiota bacterium]
MPGGETEAHLELKRQALVWSQRQGFWIGALEVRLPNCNYRADAVGYRPSRRSGEVGESVVFECKQARSDFLKDTANLETSRARLGEVRERVRGLEELLGLHHPHLRKGETLFPEFDGVDLQSVEHEGYRRARRAEEELERKIFGGTKFDDLTRWKVANGFYLVVSPGIVAAEEVPRGWGMLESGLDGNLTVRKRPERFEADKSTGLKLLEGIARRSTTRANEGVGIDGEEIWGR